MRRQHMALSSAARLDRMAAVKIFPAESSADPDRRIEA